MRQRLDQQQDTYAGLSLAVSRAVARGPLRQIGPRLYTRNLQDSPEAIVRRHAWSLVAAYTPGALIADRTALENAPATDGSVFIVAAGEERIIVPNVFRNNYLSALRALSLNENADPWLRTLDFAQRWVAEVPWSSFAATRQVLEGCHAFMDANAADEIGVRLQLPGHS